MTAIIHPWQAVELTFTASQSYANPYTDVDVFVRFCHESGVELLRPAFWDGGTTGRCASPRRWVRAAGGGRASARRATRGWTGNRGIAC